VAKFQRDGRTILFVTHAADLVRQICDRAIVLDHGHMVIDAAPGEAVRTFRETLQYAHFGEEAPPEADAGAAPTLPTPTASDRLRITAVSIEHPGLLVDRQWLLPDEPMTVRVSYHATQRTDDLLFGIAIHDQLGNHIFGTNTKAVGVAVPPAEGDGEVTFEFDHVPLLDGTYLVTLAVQSTDEGTVYDWREQQHQFSVMNPSRAAGLVSFPVEVRFADRAMEPAEGTGG
jgi:ABC-2 type transport system ATP-binding protein